MSLLTEIQLPRQRTVLINIMHASKYLIILQNVNKLTKSDINNSNMNSMSCGDLAIWYTLLIDHKSTAKNPVALGIPSSNSTSMLETRLNQRLDVVHAFYYAPNANNLNKSDIVWDASPKFSEHSRFCCNFFQYAGRGSSIYFCKI